MRVSTTKPVAASTKTRVYLSNSSESASDDDSSEEQHTTDSESDSSQNEADEDDKEVSRIMTKIQPVNVKKPPASTASESVTDFSEDEGNEKNVSTTARKMCPIQVKTATVTAASESGSDSSTDADETGVKKPFPKTPKIHPIHVKKATSTATSESESDSDSDLPSKSGAAASKSTPLKPRTNPKNQAAPSAVKKSTMTTKSTFQESDSSEDCGSSEEEELDLNSANEPKNLVEIDLDPKLIKTVKKFVESSEDDESEASSDDSDVYKVVNKTKNVPITSDESDPETGDTEDSEDSDVEAISATAAVNSKTTRLTAPKSLIKTTTKNVESSSSEDDSKADSDSANSDNDAKNKNLQLQQKLETKFRQLKINPQSNVLEPSDDSRDDSEVESADQKETAPRSTKNVKVEAESSTSESSENSEDDSEADTKIKKRITPAAKKNIKMSTVLTSSESSESSEDDSEADTRPILLQKSAKIKKPAQTSSSDSDSEKQPVPKKATPAPEPPKIAPRRHLPPQVPAALSTPSPPPRKLQVPDPPPPPPVAAADTRPSIKEIIQGFERAQQYNESIRNFQKSEQNPDKWRKMLQEKARWTVEQRLLFFVCCVCYEQYKKSDQFAKCSAIFEEDKAVAAKKETHDMCQNCLVSATLPENVNLDKEGKGIKCPFDGCDNVLLMSNVQQFLDPNTKDQILERIGNISVAGIPNLYRCPHCNYRLIVEDDKPCFSCLECQRRNCKHCDREYVGNHVGKTCQELIEYENLLEQQNKDRNKKADDLSAILVHQCHKCGIQYVKSQGCNKMTCQCGATQCYLCRARDINYNHFGEGPGKCVLFDDANVIIQQRLDAAGAVHFR